MGLDQGATKRPQPDLRGEVSEQLGALGEAGRKIAEMAATIRLRLFGPQPTPERASPAPPLASEASLETVFGDGARSIRTAQNDAAGVLQEILTKL